MLVSSLMSVMPFTNGLAFLEKVPNKFECEQFSNVRMSDLQQNHMKTWKSCTVEEICAEKMPKNKYRPVKTDEEFFDNWVEKLDMLCKPQSEVGILGSCFFFGLMVTILWMPQYSDKYGRLFVIQLTLVVQLITFIGFCFNTTITGAAINMTLLGMTHPGKNIIFFNYTLEVVPKHLKSTIVNFVMLLDACWIFILCFSFQYVDKSWKTL